MNNKLDQILNGRQFITVAELGTLHLNSLPELIGATKALFKAGADYVKVQLIDSTTAFWANRIALRRYRNHERNGFCLEGRNWDIYFRWARDSFNDRVFASVFDKRFIERFDPFVPFWKLGYKVRNRKDILKAALKTKKPVIVSCDFKDKNLLKRNDIIRMYVQPIYPTEYEQIIVPYFSPITFQGVSIHARYPYSINYAKAAITMNASIVELHAKVPEFNPSGPDSEFALTPQEWMTSFSKLCG